MDISDELVLAGLGGQLLPVASTGQHSQSDSGSSTTMQCPGMVTFQFKQSAPLSIKFRDTSTVSHGLTVVGTRAGSSGPQTGDHVALVQGGSNRNLIKFYSWRKEVPVLTCSCPERLTSLCSSNCGTFAVGAGQSGMCFIWETTSGNLIRAWKAHYMPVTAMKFLDDDAFLVTASEDAMIRVWTCRELLDDDISSSAVRSCITLSDHSLAVSDLWVGSGGLSGRLLSASQDHTLKIWMLHQNSKLDRRHLLRSIALPCPLNCVTADSLENLAFVGGIDGKIYEISLRKLDSDSQSMESLRNNSGFAASSCSLPGDVRKVFEGHSASVTCIEISRNGLLLVSGSLDGTCRIWDTSVGQTVKVVQASETSRPVVALKVVPFPLSQVKGHKAAGNGLTASQTSSANNPGLKPFKRYKENPKSVKGSASDSTPGRIVQIRPLPFSSILDSREKTDMLLNLCLASDTSNMCQTASLGDEVSDSRVNGLTPRDVRVMTDCSKLQDLEMENMALKRINSKLYSIAVDKFLENLS